jgi:hypothetical protein
MAQFVLSKIEALMQTARDNYSVNPVVFLVIYLGSAPFFYYSLFRMTRALAKRLATEVMLWSAIFLCANVAPFLYVLLFGRNLPWWVYGIIALLIGQGVFSLARKLRGKPAAHAALGAIAGDVGPKQGVLEGKYQKTWGMQICQKG